MSSQRDYVAVAKILRGEVEVVPQFDDSDALAVVERIASGLATHFEQHNPAFDRARFLTACGVTP